MSRRGFRKLPRVRGGLLGPLVLLAVLPAPANAYPRPGITERVSVSSGGAEGNHPSSRPAISAGGRYVAFSSDASTLVPGDANGRTDVYVHDRATGRTERVSVASDGAEANAFSSAPAISADGRYVAFHSSASNLVPGDTNRAQDVFVHDRATGDTERVSLATSGAEANHYSVSATISADGRSVAFHSMASNLVPGDTNGAYDVFVHDRETGLTERVSVASDGAEGDSESDTAAISADGRHVAFHSMATNLVSADTNGAAYDVFVHDRVTGTTERVSVGWGGAPTTHHSLSPAISADARYVAFRSWASNLVPADTNGAFDVFVYDRATGSTERVSVTSEGAQANHHSLGLSIGADGRHVAFYSEASNLVAGDTNGRQDAFVHDRATGTTELVSVTSDGAQANSHSVTPAISADGRHVVFSSDASNLVPGDINARADVFVYDRGGFLGVVGTPSVTWLPEGLSVEGRVAFSGTTLAGGGDPEGDATGAAPTGAELTGAALIYRPEQEDLLLRLSLASLPPDPAAGLPAVVYGADLRVGGTRYEIRALRASATADPVQSPYAALYRCAPDCTEHALLTGAFGTTGEQVLVTVPLSALGAAEGTELTGIRAFAATGEAGPGAFLVLDEVSLASSSIPAPRVELGIAAASAPESEVAFTVAASPLAGAFSATVPTAGLSSGSYRLWARVCLGASCGPGTFREVAL